jgi:uncharacterized membrane protein YtjA (UPF0391 family)
MLENLTDSGRHAVWQAACLYVVQQDSKRRTYMLHYSVVFLVVALIAGLFGFGLIASTAAGIAKVLFLVFLVLFVVSFLVGRRVSL